MPSGHTDSLLGILDVFLLSYISTFILFPQVERLRDKPSIQDPEKFIMESGRLISGLSFS